MIPKFSQGLPLELVELKEWIAWYKKPKPGKFDLITKKPLFGKPPLAQRGYTIKEGAVGYSLEKAIKDVEETVGFENGGVGLLMNERHNYVAFDLDHIESIEDLPSNMFPDRPWGKGNNPKTAVSEYLKRIEGEGSKDRNGMPLKFEIDKEIDNKLLITVAPDGYLKRI